jgi:L,D-transpeptidase YcbB
MTGLRISSALLSAIVIALLSTVTLALAEDQPVSVNSGVLTTGGTSSDTTKVETAPAKTESTSPAAGTSAPSSTNTTGAATSGTVTPTMATPDAATPSPMIAELRSMLATAPAGLAEKELADQTALSEFYAARTGPGLWVTETGFTTKARALVNEIKNADAYGLDAKDFRLPDVPDSDSATLTTGAAAAAELQLSGAALKYARFARGGRITDPAEQLNSNLDRRPQWIEPKIILERLAGNEEPDAVLRSLHPKHPQFEKLRQLYIAALPKPGAPLSAAAKRLRTNMEMWRWMNEDMGDMHVFNNIPEFMQYVYKDGKIIRTEKIVAGMLDKPSSIFSRPLKYVVLRPQWRVPESIKVNEIWPSLIRGGGLMRQYDLQVETKDGKPLDWHEIQWSKVDIRNYEVTQRSGPKSVLGHVKFSFPSQHTIYMHDTPDKYMFKASQRTLSHGCLRVQKPMELAEMILKEDKGWDKAKVAELDQSGPMNNEIAIEKRIPIHLVYFTAWVSDDGRLKLFGDVYGHEKRVTQALDGDWDKIKKGRNHLAPVETNFNPAAVAARQPPQINRILPRSAQKNATLGDIIGGALGAW